MRRRTSKLTCLVLVTLLVACMAVPALAKSGTGEYDGYNYSWSITRTSTSGRASITATVVPVTVGTAVQNQVYDDDGRVGYAFSSGSSSSGMIPVTGYVNAIATASNVFTYNGRQYTGTVTNSYGSYWINGTRVLSGIAA